MPWFARRLEGPTAIVLAALLWSTGGVFIKLAPVSGLAVVAGRSLVTVIFVGLAFRPDLRKARWSTAIVYAAMVFSFVLATKMTTAANAIFLQYTGPIYILALAPWLLKEPLRRRDVVRVGLSLVGISLFFVDEVDAGAAIGNMLGAASGLFYALSLMFLRRDAARDKGDGDASSVPSMCLGNLIAALAAIPFLGGEVDAILQPGSVMVLLYLGVVQMGVAYVLLDRGLRTTPAVTASLISMLEPLFNPIWVLIGTGETPSLWAIAGGGLVLVASWPRTETETATP